MGVVHKLTSEVIDFILLAKRNEPNVSVRKLAEVSSEKFQIPISKSSVNNILKTAQLSNPIGRPSAVKSPSSKQFTIPSQKKDLIRQSMQQSGFVEKPKPSLKKEEAPDKPIEIKTITKKDKSPREDFSKKVFSVSSQTVFKESPTENIQKEKEDRPKEQIVPKKSVDVSPPPVLLEPVIPSSLDRPEERPSLLREGNFPEEVVISQPRKHHPPPGPVLKAMGSIFLHAASLALSKKFFLADALEKIILHDDMLYFQKLVQAEVFCRGLKYFSPSVTDNFSDYGFWQLLGFNQAVERAEFQRRLVHAEFSSQFATSYFLEKEQLDLKINAIKLTLEDGSSLTMDARNSTLWLKNTPPAHLQMPVNSVVDILSQRIIANTKPLVIGVFPSSESSKAFDNFIQFLNGQRRIKKVALVDLKGNEIAQFSIIPQIKRKFIVGVYHQQAEFLTWQKMFPTELRHRTYDQELTDTTVCIRSVSTEALMPGLKIIEMSYPQTKKPFCVLVTNWVEATDEDILHEYERFWPYGAEGALANIVENKHTFFPRPLKLVPSLPVKTIEDMLIDYFQFLHEQVIDIFGENISEVIDIKLFIENIYLREGKVIITNDQMNVFLKPGMNEKSNQILDTIIREVNEKNIVDEKGRKIFITYCK